MAVDSTLLNHFSQHPLWVIARQQFRESQRNRWAICAFLVFFVLALTLALLGSAAIGEVKTDRLTILLVSLANLSFYLFPLLALLLGFDSIASERENGTLALLVVCPIKRRDIILGKFLSHALLLAFASIAGFGLVFLLTGLLFEDAHLANIGQGFTVMIALSLLLGLGFLAISLVISLWARQRSGAAGMAFATWIIMVVLYDIMIFALLAGSKGAGLIGVLVPFLILINPVDSYRIAIASLEENMVMIGGTEAFTHSGYLWGAMLSLLLWVVLPLGIAIHQLKKNEL